MKWITAQDLEQWADRIPTRVTFPAMMADLITASASDISDIRFPSGDKGQVRGFDGWLEATTGAPPHVPAGRSIWEFGVTDGPAAKFKKDYEKRVGEISAADRADLTFVFASPRTWDNPQKKLPDFVAEYRKKGDFRSVQYIDGAMLEGWLEKCSAVGARHAREVLGRIPKTGARSTDEFWDEYARRFQPQITEDVVLCARDTQASDVVTHLMGKPGSLLYLADGPDEVTAFTVAAIRKAAPQDRAFLEARTLVVETDDAGRQLAVPDRYGFVLAPTVTQIAGRLASVGPTVAGLGFTRPGRSIARLSRPSTREMAQALKTMGLGEEEAQRLAAKSGRSLTILARHAPAAGYEPPAWASDGQKLLPALLAGGWDSRHEGDKAILSELAGSGDYFAYDAQLRGFLQAHDSPLDLEGGVWKLRAPVDAFTHLSYLLTGQHLDQLGAACIKIFSALPPEEDNEGFGAAKEPYSHFLRDGIATTLLVIAALHAELALEVGRDPQRFAEETITNLPGLSSDPRVILALEHELPILMEAAPDPLLSALELLLEGKAEQAKAFFIEENHYGFPRSNLPSLMAALEVAAWDASLLLRVSLLLARLAEIDPGGRIGNRPGASLRDIFVAWNPGTNAPLTTRLAVLDTLVDAYPRAGWNLLAALLPKSHDSKSPTQQPRFRDAGASNREKLTRGLVAMTYDEVTDRVLLMLLTDVDRWLIVLDSFANFSPDRRVQFLDALEDFAKDLNGEARVTLRRKARSIADRHARFRNAPWALPDSDLQRLNRVVSELETSDPIDRARTLFDEWSPGLADDYKEAEHRIAERRSAAVAVVVADGGANALLALSRLVRTPQLVAETAAQTIDDTATLFDALDRAEVSGADRGFAIALAGAMRWKGGVDFDAWFLIEALGRNWDGKRAATLLLGWPELPKTWALVETLSEEAQSEFWRHREPRRFDGSSEELRVLVSHFLTAGRAGTALAAIHGRENELDWSLITAILRVRVEEINKRESLGALDDYYIEELFKKLRERIDIPKEDLANWEFAYFPMLEMSEQDLTLFELMASDPDFFMSLLSKVFVADDVAPDTVKVSETDSKLATSAFRILIRFDRAPGESNGVVNAEALNRWVDGMIAAAQREKRMRIVYSYIGRALAHSSDRDGSWPQRPVIDVIERLKSPELQSGLRTELFNMRGVSTKAIFEGGEQERDLAKQYRDWASKLPVAALRTKATLEEIAKGWDAQASEADASAARDRLRFE